jgi:hypothetical protein
MTKNLNISILDYIVSFIFGIMLSNCSIGLGLGLITLFILHGFLSNLLGKDG